MKKTSRIFQKRASLPLVNSWFMHVFNQMSVTRLQLRHCSQSVSGVTADMIKSYCGRGSQSRCGNSLPAYKRTRQYRKVLWVWWLAAAWSKLKGFHRDRRKQHKHVYSCFSFPIAKTPWAWTTTHKTYLYYRVHFCAFRDNLSQNGCSCFDKDCPRKVKKRTRQGRLHYG